MRKSILSAGCAALLTTAFPPVQAAVDVSADNPLIRYQGRFDASTPKKPRCDWPGTSIEARFTGKSIPVKISGGTNDFNVLVDGQWKSKLTVDGKTSQVAAEGLAEGTHTLLLSKRTEGNQGITTFEGFQLEDGKTLVDSRPPPAARIQFIGDSYTAGYGDEAKMLNCPDRRPYDNNYVAYGPVAARALGAEYSVQAVSGIGMVHNYGDTSPLSVRPMPSYFENTLYGSDKLKWNLAGWVPDIVVVALGTNDFSTAVKPTEAQYAGAYKDFLKKLKSWFPKAEFICLTFSGDNYQQKYVDAIVADVTAAGDAKVHRAHMPSLASADLGCDYHPNVSGQQKYADALVPILRQYLGSATLINPEGQRQGRAREKNSETDFPSVIGETWMVPYPEGLPGNRADARGRQIVF